MIASVKRIVTLVVGADTNHMKVVISQSEILSRNHTKISIKRGTFFTDTLYSVWWWLCEV